MFTTPLVLMLRRHNVWTLHITRYILSEQHSWFLIQATAPTRGPVAQALRHTQAAALMHPDAAAAGLTLAELRDSACLFTKEL